MLDDHIAQTVIDEALSKGADFCDIFVEKSKNLHIEGQNQKVENLSCGLDYGIGIRLIIGTEVFYGYTNSPQKDELISIVRSLASAYKGQKIHQPVQDKSATVPSPPILNHKIINGLDNDVALDEKINFLKLINKHLFDEHDLVVNSKSMIMQKWQQIQVFNSKGLKSSDDRHYLRFVPTVFVQDGSQKDMASEAQGGMVGWDFISTLNPAEISREVVRRAITSLKANHCPAGKMPVVIENGFGGVIFHEACGHLLETTSVEKKASVFHDKMGEQIANSLVCAVDNGQIENSWGSISIDDEGYPTQKTQLIKDGQLVNFMVDYIGHLKTGYPMSGSGRRQSYKFPPASRMRNTYIEAGPNTTEEMIASIGSGLYAKVMGGGSVQPGTGEFNFATLEAHLIKNGKVDKPVRGATLIGTGPDVLKKISMVGDELKLATGLCGSVSGNIPVTVGQPSIKVDEILVGGYA